MDKPSPKPSRKATAGLPTISDVAQLAGVSRAVASRALSSEPRPISSEKRERVLAAAETLGYRPNLLAQGLNTRSVNVVAVLVNHVHDLSDLDLLDIVLNEVQAIGKQVLLIAAGSVERLDDFLRTGVAYHVDAALVFSDFADAATVRKMFRSDFAIMLNGRHDALSPAVVPDDAMGIRDAVADAAANGVRSAALITGRATSLVEQARVAAYRQAFGEQGIDVWRVIQGDYSYASGHVAGAAFLGDDHPEAVFCTSDAMAMGVLDACRVHFPGNRPTRFRLYGFDNLSLTSYDAYPIASIGYDKQAFVEKIMGYIENPASFEAGAAPASLPTRFFARATAPS